MSLFHWIAGCLLGLIWFSRVVEAAIGMPKVADVSRPEWDRSPVTSNGHPFVSIIVPARNEEANIARAVRSVPCRCRQGCGRPSGSSDATDPMVGGVQASDTLRVSDKTLQLNGAGVRRKFMFKRFPVSTSWTEWGD